ncbi:MAG: nucleotidyltransferase [Kiritimatiellae bacterium]|nr:nucleotidyltransferase [Kiritimatiellia bacterium]
MKPALVILAAGMGSRYGGLKQMDAVGPGGETIMDYSVYDAIRAGFGKVVFIIRRDFETLFRDQIGSKYSSAIAVDYAFQDKNDLPAGYALPAEREKPWGTAHAIRSARHCVDTPFAAINADDFYGRDAFAQLSRFFTESESRPVPDGFITCAMVGYRLDLTLSENGSVARGICDISEGGKLRSVTEMTKIVKTQNGAENREDPANPVKLTGKELVSMNCWGFSPRLFAALEERFPLWLDAHIGQPKAEWYIPFVVDALVHQGSADVSVLPTESSWFGVTYREDKPHVVDAIRKLVAAGEYPAKLWP